MSPRVLCSVISCYLEGILSLVVYYWMRTWNHLPMLMLFVPELLFTLSVLTRCTRDFLILLLNCSLVSLQIVYYYVMWILHHFILLRQVLAVYDKFLRLLVCRVDFANKDVPLRSKLVFALW